MGSIRMFHFPNLRRELPAIEWQAVVATCAFVGAVTFFLLLMVSLVRVALAPAATNQWNATAIRSDFVEMKLEQVDKSKAALVFYYDLTNRTNFDYHLPDNSRVQFERRLRSTGSVVPEGRLQLISAGTVQSGNQTRIALEIVEPFAWPNRMDNAAATKIRDLMAQETNDLDGFVILDGAQRVRIDLKVSWQLPQHIAVAPN